MSQRIGDPLEAIHAKKIMDANEFQRALGDFPTINGCSCKSYHYGHSLALSSTMYHLLFISLVTPEGAMKQILT